MERIPSNATASAAPNYNKGQGGTGGSGGNDGAQGGSTGTNPNGATYGGGGGGAGNSTDDTKGGDGAVRIIWGDISGARAFPSTNTGDL